MDYRPQMPYTPNPYYPNTIPPCAATNPGFYALPEVIPGLAQKNPLFNAITQGEARPNMMLPSADANQPDAAVGTGSMPMAMSPTTGMQNPMGSPSTLVFNRNQYPCGSLRDFGCRRHQLYSHQ